jgi:hypothetical protein
MPSPTNNHEMYSLATEGSLAPRSALGAHRGNPPDRSTLRLSHDQLQQTSGPDEQYQQGSGMLYGQSTSRPPPSYQDSMADTPAKAAPGRYPERFYSHQQSSHDVRSADPASGFSPISDVLSAQAKETAGTPLPTPQPSTSAHLDRDFSSTAGDHTPTRDSGPGGFPVRGGDRVYVRRLSETAEGAAVTGETQTQKKHKSRTRTTGCGECGLEAGCYACLAVAFLCCPS